MLNVLYCCHQGVVFYDLRNSTRPPLKQLLNRLPCSCQNLGCGCCAGMSVQIINFNRRACMNLTYDPYEFSLTARMYMNDDIIFERSISGKNPPPICVPVPIPYVEYLHFCVLFFDIFTPGVNIHMCMDFEAYYKQSPLAIIHFDCMRMGADGLAWIKPEDNGGLPLPTAPGDDNQGVAPVAPADPDYGDEIYDEVAPGKEHNSTFL
ncbi:uncharacterized protein [Anabrus simplex]|uniref:uncharacterized protein n=1 Tax=Anabrus simplex TaxID=316456 RepID=UPI0035A2C54E